MVKFSAELPQSSYVDLEGGEHCIMSLQYPSDQWPGRTLIGLEVVIDGDHCTILLNDNRRIFYLPCKKVEP